MTEIERLTDKVLQNAGIEVIKDIRDIPLDWQTMGKTVAELLKEEHFCKCFYRPINSKVGVERVGNNLHVYRLGRYGFIDELITILQL